MKDLTKLVWSSQGIGGRVCGGRVSNLLPEQCAIEGAQFRSRAFVVDTTCCRGIAPPMLPFPTGVCVFLTLIASISH